MIGRKGSLSPNLPLSVQIDLHLAAVMEPVVELALPWAQHQINGAPFFVHQMWGAASRLQAIGEVDPFHIQGFQEALVAELPIQDQGLVP